MATGLQALTEKEKQTLRLVVRGYDAKSMARHLGLSVHTVNERLRFARRKLEVSSSREAARLLLGREDPQLLGTKQLGAAEPPQPRQDAASPDERTQPRALPVVVGVLAMSILIAALSLTALSTPAPSAEAPVSSAEPSQVEGAARGWLEMIDRADWAGSYAGTAEQFRSVNTLATWTAVSERVRAPLGAVRARALISDDFVPAPPQGYRMVKFRTRFVGKANVVESVSLVREGGAWKVAGVVVD